MNPFFKHLFTGKDNQTYDISRVMLCVGFVAYIIFTGFHVYTKGEFDSSGFGVGMGSFLGGSGMGIGAKAIMKGEPE